MLSFFIAYIDLYASKFFCFDFDDLIKKLFTYNFKRKRFVYQKLGLFSVKYGSLKERQRN